MKNKKDRVVRNGKVAVAYSPSFGAGWVSWNRKISPFEPKVIEMIEGGKREQITKEWCIENLGFEGFCSGAEDLEIIWLDKGTKFRIEEYDGSESIVTEEDLVYIA